MENEKQYAVGALVIVVSIVLGLSYSTINSQPGVEVSCKDNKIVDFRTTAPPMASIYAQKYCDVSMDVYTTGADEKRICNEKRSITGTPVKVIECKELERHEGERLRVEVEFYEPNSEYSDSRDKEEKYMIYRAER